MEKLVTDVASANEVIEIRSVTPSDREAVLGIYGLAFPEEEAGMASRLAGDLLEESSPLLTLSWVGLVGCAVAGRQHVTQLGAAILFVYGDPEFFHWNV